MSWSGSSVGLVRPQRFVCDRTLELASGGVLEGFELVYETYGQLDSARSNAILVCHALSGNHHAAGRHDPADRKPGWWEACIGPGRPIDTNRFFVVSVNNLGGCHGSTGPLSTNPATAEPWGPCFPTVRVRDWVHSQAMLADHLGVSRWAAVIGGSLGGMQALRWSLLYPERLRHCVVIAAATKLSAQNLAFNEIARQAIQKDPGFADGYYFRKGSAPTDGLALARMVGHVTYLSDDAMAARFGRELRTGGFEPGEDLEFQVQSYLRYQGSQFSNSFDANTYILMTRALDYFDLARDYGDDLVAAFRGSRCRYLVLSFSTDWRFAPARSREIVDALIAARRPVSYAEIEASEGHDAFLLPIARYLDVLGTYLAGIGDR